MSDRKDLLDKFNLPEICEGEDDGDMMSNEDYIRQSASLINDALQKGFDAMQMANGEIILTGTKTVTYKYRWDDKKSRLVRVNSRASSGKNMIPKVKILEES